MISKSAVLRVAPLVRARLSRAHALRLDGVVGVVGEDGRAGLGEVLQALYPRLPRGRALTALRQFRIALGVAAEEAGVRLSLVADGQTRSAPEDRFVWFEGEDRVTEEVTRLVAAEVAGVERSRQDVLRPLRVFVSYARDDNQAVRMLVEELKTLFAGDEETDWAVWSDHEIAPGSKWREEIQGAMEGCDLALLLMSPACRKSRFIQEQELPYLRAHKRLVPVALKPVPQRAEELQIFFDAEGKTFFERANARTRSRFALELYEKLRRRPERPPQAEGLPHRLGVDEDLLAAIGEFDEGRFVRTEGMATTLSKGIEAAPEIDASRRVDALDFLLDWIGDEKGQPYCALLGEYGMGKTTTCKALARELLERRGPLPIYLDLRHVGESAQRELVLEEILELILKRSWRGGPGRARLSVEELVRLVSGDGAVVIWDGLDEVLVHLSDNAGRVFTRQLFRILPPGRRGRMLISCRTHYFRTLRDQQTHFRAEDRDGVRVEDYRAPFVLLPFTESQILSYLKATVGEERADGAWTVLRSVHNLPELAERPYTLSLIVEELAQVERWKADGRRVTGLMLYRHMVRSWLERDSGKHQITPDHKQSLMEYCAAELWRSGGRSWGVEELEAWLIGFLEARPELAAHYRGKAPEVLKEDLRTATFLVRDSRSDRFQFAHTSLQEFFLAGYLRRALVEGRVEGWEIGRVSRETLEFLGQWLLEEGEKGEVMATLGRLRDSYRERASVTAFEYFLLAHEKGYPAPSAAGFQLPGADLREFSIMGGEGAPLVLVGANFGGARLWNTKWRWCTLSGALFDGASAYRAEWLECHLGESIWEGAELEGAVFRDCGLGRADYSGAVCRRTQFVRCRVGEAIGLPGDGLFALCGGREGRPERPPQAGGLPHLAVAAGHRGPVNGCAWSPDGRRIVSASYDQTLRIWEVESGACLATLRGHSDFVQGCGWSPDGRRIVSAADDKTLRVWDAESGARLATLAGHSDDVWGCAWSPDGRRIASASADKTLRIWEAESGACLATLSGHTSYVRGCAWSPDGRRIVSASHDKTLRTWEVESGACLATLAGHTEAVWGCAWSPDGRRIVSASDDRTLRIWEAEAGACLATLAGHTGPVWGCAWSPEGRRIVSASRDDTLRIWEAESGACVASLAGHASSVFSCAWSPEGRRIVSASYDGTVRIWEAESGGCMAVLGGGGTEKEPGRYEFPDSSWAEVDLAGNRILGCSEGAWRWLGWVDKDGWLPAETFGPLPVRGNKDDGGAV